jgi:hypothetical protein
MPLHSLVSPPDFDEHEMLLHVHACDARPFHGRLQDPAYPVYVDSSVIMGMTGDYNAGSTGFDGIQYMPCSPDNDFFPDLSKVLEPAPQQHSSTSPAAGSSLGLSRVLSCQLSKGPLVYLHSLHMCCSDLA